MIEAVYDTRIEVLEHTKTDVQLKIGKVNYKSNINSVGNRTVVK